MNPAGFAELDAALQGLLTRLEPTARRKLAQDIAKRLRQSNQQRIAAQVAPDGTPYTPRLRQGNGIKRKLFTRLRTARWLKIRATASEAVVEFVGRAARIARVHHYGLRDRVSPRGAEHRYAERPLVGFSGEDYALLEMLVLKHLA